MSGKYIVRSYKENDAGEIESSPVCIAERSNAALANQIFDRWLQFGYAVEIISPQGVNLTGLNKKGN